MSLVTNLQNAFTRIGTEFKTIRSEISSASTANRARANHTGTQSADTLTDGTTNKAFLATERTKLTGIAAGATANQSDSYLLSRANHTGTQTASTISDLGTTVKAYRLNEFAVPNAAVAFNSQKITGLANGAAASQDAATVAQVESASTNDRARANHTGTQPASTISDFNTAADARVANVTGSLANLNTTNKSNLVSAINEIKTTADGAAANTGAINDSTTSTTTTWSSSKTNSSIISAVSNVVSGAPAALDTLNELATALGNDANFAATTATALGNRVRVDAAQSFTAPQQAQARANISAVFTSDIGDPETNFVNTFEAALA